MIVRGLVGFIVVLFISLYFMAFIRKTQFIFYGYSNFGKSGYESMKNKDVLKFKEERLAVVTGANQGIGFSASKQLLEMGCEVVIVARRKEAGEEAVEKLKEMVPNSQVSLKLCDVSVEEDVSRLIEEIKALKRLDYLVLNAGVMLTEKEPQYTATNVEKHLATNIVSNVQMIDALLPKLKQSPDPRVILVASGGGITEPLVLNDKDYLRGFDGTTAYAKTKRMQMVLAHFYARKEKDVFFASMHPGWTVTQGVQKSMPGFYEKFKDMMRSESQGADTISWLCACARPEVNGAYYRDRAVELEHFWGGFTSYSEEEEEQLYQYLKSKIKN